MTFSTSSPEPHTARTKPGEAVYGQGLATRPQSHPQCDRLGAVRRELSYAEYLSASALWWLAATARPAWRSAHFCCIGEGSGQ